MRFRQLFLLFLFCTVPAVQAKDRDSSRRPSNVRIEIRSCDGVLTFFFRETGRDRLILKP